MSTLAGFISDQLHVSVSLIIYYCIVLFCVKVVI